MQMAKSTPVRKTQTTGSGKQEIMEKDNTIFDLCIIGAGMFGSAAARHASAVAGTKVCLIGPDEPTMEEKKSRTIFGAHYDEGRIIDNLDTEVPTQTLARRSMSQYRELEDLSGIQFYFPVGYLVVGEKDSSYMKKISEIANISKLPFIDLSHNDLLKRRYPYFNFKTDDQSFLDDMGGGHISPRNIVAARKKVAQEQGCHLINDVVEEVKPLKNNIHEVITEKGGMFKAKRVLICTGAFTNFKKFPIPKLKISLNKETAAFLKMPLEEVERISSMPSMIYVREEDNMYYILPPIKYPDGHYYLKIGHLDFEGGPNLQTLDDIKEWYLSEGNTLRIKTFSEFINDILPDLKYEGITVTTCVTCANPGGLPFIDRVSPTVTVAAVGNGKGAKLSEEIGRIAATLSLTGKWDSELSQSLFKVIYE